jgi:hypothetical protein
MPHTPLLPPVLAHQLDNLDLHSTIALTTGLLKWHHLRVSTQECDKQHKGPAYEQCMDTKCLPRGRAADHQASGTGHAPS